MRPEQQSDEVVLVSLLLLSRTPNASTASKHLVKLRVPQFNLGQSITAKQAAKEGEYTA